jgi:hypothetical protein
MPGSRSMGSARERHFGALAPKIVVPPTTAIGCRSQLDLRQAGDSADNPVMGQADDQRDSSTSGRYLARLSSRCGVTLATAFILQGAARDWADAGVGIPGWAVGVMVLAFGTAIALAAAMWFVPATTYDQAGIHRRFGKPRDVTWDDVVDLPVVPMWVVFERVTVRLRNGRTIRLDGVPPDAVPGLRRLFPGEHAPTLR